MKDVPNLLPKDGVAQYVENFFSADECRGYFSVLQSKVQWKQEPLQMFGRSLMQPRLTALIGDSEKPYRYSGLTMQPENWPAEIFEMKNKLEAVLGCTFTSALANNYRDENDSMGWHQDDERELGINPLIASVSFGASRMFRFRHLTDSKLKVSVELASGSLLVMSGETQHHWQHALPKTKGPKAPRINLTFRTILEAPQPAKALQARIKKSSASRG